MADGLLFRHFRVLFMSVVLNEILNSQRHLISRTELNQQWSKYEFTYTNLINILIGTSIHFFIVVFRPINGTSVKFQITDSAHPHFRKFVNCYCVMSKQFLILLLPVNQSTATLDDVIIHIWAQIYSPLQYCWSDELIKWWSIFILIVNYIWIRFS